MYAKSRGCYIEVVLYKANIKRVIKYGIFSRVFLSLFLLKYQRILMSWYFKRNKARNTSENVPYLITSFIFDLLIITTNALFCKLLNISVKYWSRGGAIYLHWKRIFNYQSNQHIFICTNLYLTCILWMTPLVHVK